MTGKNKKIKYGTKDILSSDEFNPRNVKIRITTFIDLDLLETLKKISKAKGLKYQTLLNSLLRTALEDELEQKSIKLSEKRLRKIIREELGKQA